MKIFNKKYLILVFLALTLSLCTFFCTTNPASVHAENSSGIFSVIKDEGEGTSGATVENNSVAYVRPSNRIIAQMNEPTAGSSIDFISPYIKYNGEYVDSTLKDNYLIDLSYTMNSLRLILSFNSTTADDRVAPYGKFEIEIGYILKKQDGTSTQQNISYSFYALKSSDYYDGKNVNATYTNCNLVEKQLVMSYDRNYQYNYQLSSVDTVSNTLPSLTVNYKHIRLSIKKTFQKTEQTQTIKFDGQDVQTDNNIVYVNINRENETVSITFNNLGVYEISYDFIYCYNDKVENLQKSNEFTSTKHKDLLEIFGYQLYYSDTETGTLKEFKNINENGVMRNEITDFSYLVEKYNQALSQNERQTTLIGKLNNGDIFVQKTNQAPVQFTYNVEIFNSDNATYTNAISGYWKLTKDDDGKYIAGEKINYDNSPLTEEGIYLINLVYKYTPTVTGADGLCNTTDVNDGETQKLRSQWFLFEITKTTTSVSITTQESNKSLNDGNYTKEDVRVMKKEQSTSIFNAKTKLVVSFQENYSGSYVDTEITDANGLTFTKNGNYKTTLYFGKNLNRSYSSTFTIDKESIENIQIFSVKENSYNKTYYIDKQIDFLTSQSVYLSWNTKQSGSKITAQYKYIPLIRSSLTYTSDDYKKYYNEAKGYAILSQYEFNIVNNYTAVDYSGGMQAKADSVIAMSSILSQSGLYVFKLTDTAGNEKIFAFVIDKTPGKILQQVGDVIEQTSGDNIISSSATAIFGKSKVIKFNNINSIGGKFETNDEWLNEVLNNSELFANYFQILNISAVDSVYLKSAINSKVLQYKNGELTFIDNNEANKYSTTLNFEDSTDYTFFTQDAARNNSTLSATEYQTNYSASYKVRLSSDASRTNFVFSKNGENQLLMYMGDSVINEEQSQKDHYFIPTTEKTLSDSGEILKLQFLAKPEEGVLEVSEVSYSYTPFSTLTKKEDSKTAYTYCFDTNNAVKSIIYSKNDPSKNLATLNNETNLYEWEINKEYVLVSGSYQTKSGKYTITRKYATLTSTTDKLTEKNDYLVRTFTFIIDRNGIISTPQLTEDTQTMHSYVGDAIKVIVGESDSAVTFDDIYLATNTKYNNTPILETNKLPVFLWIPSYTYGYAFSAGTKFNEEGSIINYTNELSGEKVKITSYSLSATVQYALNISELDLSKEIYTGTAGEEGNNYISFNNDGTSSARTFKKVGYYRVTIKKNTPCIDEYGQDTYSFIFSISASQPKFSITNEDGTEFNKDRNQTSYTNQNSIQLRWEDSTNKFDAKINKEAIYYSINGKAKVQIKSSLISTDENMNIIKLNLKDINGYHNGDKIQFFMQYEGNESDYPTNCFQTSSVLCVDTVAPEKNVNNLVSLSGINKSDLRVVEDKYNTSTTTGLYKYFAFAVDISKLEAIIDFAKNENGESYLMYYRVFEDETTGENTKYNNIYSQETTPNEFENAIQKFTTISDIRAANDLISDNENLLNKYIEIVEQDLAGNITIYTIYLSDLSKLSTSDAIVYSQNNKELSQKINHASLNSNTSIYAKSSFEINDFSVTNGASAKYIWNKVTIKNNTYIRTPYSSDKYYDLSKYNPIDIESSETNLVDITKLGTSNQKQTIKFELVPLYGSITLSVSVLNTSLSVLHTSTISEYSSQEGILIKIPNSSSSIDATIYATRVQIDRYVLDKESDNYVAKTIYLEDKDLYFASAGQQLVSTTLYSLSYVSYFGNTYIKIIVASPVTNTFYKYEVTDNFNETYKSTNIYNSEVVEKELACDVDFVELYESGVKYYYTTSDVTFTYNSAKDKIILTVSTQNGSYIDSQTFDLSQSEDIDKYNNSGFGTWSSAQDSKICIVKMQKVKQDMSNSLTGGERKFTIKKYIAIDDTTSVQSYDTLNVVIFNRIPEITLLGTLNQNENELFNKDAMYGSDIKITFKQSSSKILCDVYLQPENKTIEKINSGKVVSEAQKYYLIIKYTSIFTNSMYDVVLEFTISNNESEFYKVVYRVDGTSYYANKVEGNGFTYQEADGTIERTIDDHFILNTKDYEIVCNTEQGFKENGEPEKIVTNGIETYIHHLISESDRPNSCIVAISIIPKSNSILKNYAYYKDDGTPVSFSGTYKTFVVSKDEDSTTTKRISWQSYYGIESNRVSVTITYGDSQTSYTPKLTTADNVTSLTLTTSGIYYLMFSDIAGNVHMFNNTTATYRINYLKTVIYTVNDESPINNAIYNSDVVIRVPAYTSSYYDQTGQPKLYAERNGETYSPEKDSSNRTYTFSETGLYKVWFSASVTDSGEKMEINEQPLYFLIIKEKESRWAFSFSEYENYYVKQILKNEEDVTSKLTNANMGNIIYKEEVKDGKKVQVPYLKNFTLSTSDALTGKGLYTVTIATDNEFSQEFTFGLWLNNQTPSIQVSKPENSETTDTIKVTFNTNDVLEDVGDCVLKITGKDDIYINYDNLSDGKIKSIYEIELTDNRTYFIQLYSESGRLLYSYRVVKNEPLNAVSIIVIVVSCLVVVGLTLTFILLRKKMKVR